MPDLKRLRTVLALRKILTATVLVAVGVSGVVHGVGLVYPPAEWIVGGLVLLVCGAFLVDVK